MTDQPRRKYTAEFKREAVELVTKQGYTTEEAARNLGIRSNMLHRWRKQLSAGQQNAFPGSGHQSAEIAELNRLREENRQLRLEREILKKAAAFFAKESG
jgi:transposase